MMRNALAATGLALCTACATQAEWRAADALAADTLEVQLDRSGRNVEIEYHVPPQEVPEAVHAAMNELHPGGRVVGAEKEYVGDTLYWELTVETGGREAEAMFLPDGTLHSEEVEVSAEDVPGPVRGAVAERMAGHVNKWEVIRNGAGELVEYHAKVSSGGRNYKLLVSPKGSVRRVYREVGAEIEVPLEDD